ncbi:MAG TPA: nitrophenyl compound nitroreductase subunit ArsF family protein [Paludibacteraceae bacterium]|jgi:hypothetical protein|nr:nitrophenyl compound nitroreductase subunit ArsF family protein [Paludibacteraceae bacterium]
MKNLILLLMLAVGMVSYAGNPTKKETSNSKPKDRIEVIYFYGKQRCPTCLAIEKNTKELLQTSFANELKDGSVVFRQIDISLDENEQIADKYEVSWSSLFFVEYKNGKEQRENLTEYAFTNARNSPDEFKAVLKNKLEQMLKD